MKNLHSILNVLLYIALMRNYKSIGFNYTYILLYLTAIIIIFENNEDFNFFLEISTRFDIFIVFVKIRLNAIKIYKKNNTCFDVFLIF